MSLSILRGSRLLNNSAGVSRVVYMRAYLGHVIAERPPPAAKQWRPPASEVGYFEYTRDFSRDPRYSKPPKVGDTAMRAMTRKLGHAFEVYPLFGLVTIWFVIFVYTIYISFDKIEVWLDHSQSLPPWDWERARDNYYKRHTVCFDTTGKSHVRLPIMEQLQDEMIAAAKERGTR